MLNLEAKKALCRKLDIDWDYISTNGLFNATDIQDFVQSGVDLAWEYKPWTAKEHTYKLTATSDAYYDYPNTFEDESISRLSVAGKEYTKVNWDDYQKALEDAPSNTDRIWAEHGRFFFVTASAGDEICITGKLRHSTLSGDNDLLPFSTYSDDKESSGNRAVILLAYAEALDSEKKKDTARAEVQRKNAYRLLDILWAPMDERRAQETNYNRPFFNVPDFFGKRRTDENHFE